MYCLLYLISAVDHLQRRSLLEHVEARYEVHIVGVKLVDAEKDETCHS